MLRFEYFKQEKNDHYEIELKFMKSSAWKKKILHYVLSQRSLYMWVLFMKVKPIKLISLTYQIILICLIRKRYFSFIFKKILKENQLNSSFH